MHFLYYEQQRQFEAEIKKQSEKLFNLKGEIMQNFKTEYVNICTFQELVFLNHCFKLHENGMYNINLNGDCPAFYIGGFFNTGVISFTNHQQIKESLLNKKLIEYFFDLHDTNHDTNNIKLVDDLYNFELDRD